MAINIIVPVYNPPGELIDIDHKALNKLVKFMFNRHVQGDLDIIFHRHIFDLANHNHRYVTISCFDSLFNRISFAYYILVYIVLMFNLSTLQTNSNVYIDL